MQLHQQGQWLAAEAAYQAIVAAQPDALQALQLLAVVQMQRGQPSRAVATLQQALTVDPRHIDLRVNLGAALEALGRWDEALAQYDQALAMQPRHLIALTNRSNVLRQLGRAPQALQSVEQALAANDAHASAWMARGAALLALQRAADALASYDRALAIQPAHPSAWLGRGRAWMALGRAADALPCFERALQLQPNLPDDWLQRGHALQAMSRPSDAAASRRRAVALWSDAVATGGDGSAPARQHLAETLNWLDAELAQTPPWADGWHLHGAIQLALQRHDDAIASFDRTLAVHPAHPDAANDRAMALVAVGRLDEALMAYHDALHIRPDDLPAQYNRANTLLRLGRLDDALTAIEAVVQRQPTLANAWVTQGGVQLALNRPGDAVASYDRALALAPNDAIAWSNRGQALICLKRYDEAEVSLAHALHWQPDMPAALNNRGNLWLERRLPDQALADYDRVTQLTPDDAQAWANRGNALMLLNRLDEAIDSHDRALALGLPPTVSSRVFMHCLQKAARWDRLPDAWAAEREALRAGRSAGTPLPLLAHPQATAADQLQAARAYFASHFAAAAPSATPVPTPARDRLRIAYLSGDFRDHAVSRLMAGVFDAHDRTRFEVFAVSYGPPTDHPLRKRIEAGIEHFIDIAALNDAQALAQLRSLQFDLAVDLTGFTEHHRFALLAERIAPVQVSYLGYPATSGAPCIDYLLGDRWVTPRDDAATFSESCALLPESFQANDDQRQIAPATPTRAALGLPDDAFVFCCLNNTYKVTPLVYDIWMRLLRQIPGSVLWLLGDNDIARRNLRREAQARGVPPERIVFATRLPYEQYLAQYRQADLFLDTLPFNAGTTASDALWAGLPVLTQLGTTFAGRMAASLLDNVGLPELITRSADEYEALAIKLATDPALLAQLRGRLKDGLPTAPLFDTRRFTRHLESAFTHMVERQRRGLPPDTFAVPPLPR
jgi:predicted O-linked N-acetylglucosamine transferase (SPINDLY family)